MCGKDGTQMGVYKLRGKHERGGGTEKSRKKKGRRKKKRLVLVTREKHPRYQLKNLERS